jgi:hypothetical protein
MNILRKGIRDTDGASVLSSRTKARRVVVGLVAEAGDGGVAEAEQAAFVHACGGGKEQLRTCAAVAVAEFLASFASEIGVSARRVFYSFVLAFVHRIETFKGTGEFMLGDTARSFMVFPLVAYSLMNPLPMHPNPIQRVVDLCTFLNTRMPSREEVHTWQGSELELKTTRMNARCAIPFAFGLNKMIPNEKLDFVVKALVNGEAKSVRYFLAFVSKDHDEEDGSESESGDGGGGAESEDGGGGAEAGAGAGAGAGGGVAGGGDRGSSESQRQTVYMRPFLSKSELRAILERIPADSVFDFLKGFGLHNSHQTSQTPTSAVRELILQERPFVPPCKGSVLRAYCRSILDISIDTLEPEIQTFSDCVLPATDDSSAATGDSSAATGDSSAAAEPIP